MFGWAHPLAPFGAVDFDWCQVWTSGWTSEADEIAASNTAQTLRPAFVCPYWTLKQLAVDKICSIALCNPHSTVAQGDDLGWTCHPINVNLWLCPPCMFAWVLVRPQIDFYFHTVCTMAQLCVHHWCEDEIFPACAGVDGFECKPDAQR